MKRFILCISLLLLLAIPARAGEPEPTWIQVAPVRAVSTRSLGAVLADIDSRLVATGLGSSQTYRSADLGTWAHEGAHGVNSRIRNTYGRGTEADNAFYVLWGRAAIIAEPQPVTLQDAARYVPLALRGETYKTYMVDSLSDWNEAPLYALDEWTAYVNGAIHNLSMAEQGRSIGDGSGDLLFTAESAMHSLSVVIAVDARLKRDPQFRYDDTQLRLYVAWNWNRMMQLFADGRQYRQFQDPMPYYRVFSHGEAGKDWRQWSRHYFGADWVAAVMDTKQD